MKAFARSAAMVGQVLGLVMGTNFTAPVDETLVRYGHLSLGL